MNFRKSLIYLILILLASCSVRHPFTQLSSNEQCETLYKKRMKSDRISRPKKLNRNSVKARPSRTIFSQSQPLMEETQKMQIETSLVPDEVQQPKPINLADRSKVSFPGRDKEVNNESGLTMSSNPQTYSKEIAKPAKVKKWKLSHAPALVALSSLIALAGLKLFRAKLKSVSLWAAKNPKTSRGIIATSQVLTGGAAFLTGGILYDQGFLIADAVSPIALACAASATVFYPLRNTVASYVRRKSHDVALYGAGTVLALSVGNSQVVPNTFPSLRQPIAKVQSLTHEKIDSFSITMKPSQLPQKEPQKYVGLKVLLTLLTIFAFAALASLVAALSCSLSCNGAGALAVVVLFGGLYLAVIGAAAVIRKIWGLKRKKNKATAVSPETRF